MASSVPAVAVEQAKEHWLTARPAANGWGRIADRNGMNRSHTSFEVNDETLVPRTVIGLGLVAQAMRPLWPTITATLASAVACRSEQIGTAGLAETLNDLHPQLRWSRGHLVIAKAFDEIITFSGQELVVCPSAVEHERLLVQVCDPDNATIIVPDRDPLVLGKQLAALY